MTKKEILVDIKKEILRISVVKQFVAQNGGVVDYTKLDSLLEDLHQDGYDYGYDDCTADQ